MNRDAAAESERSSTCCFCGTHIDGVTVMRHQLLGSPTGVPLNLWVCGRCVTTAALSGYGVAGLVVELIPSRRIRTATLRLTVLVGLIILGALAGLWVAVVYPLVS